jgi:hypothetical protein
LRFTLDRLSPAYETFPKFDRRQAGHHIFNAVVGGYTIRQRDKLAQPIQFGMTKIFYRFPTFSMAAYRTHHQNQDVQQLVAFVTVYPGIFQHGKMLK